MASGGSASGVRVLLAGHEQHEAGAAKPAASTATGTPAWGRRRSPRARRTRSGTEAERDVGGVERGPTGRPHDRPRRLMAPGSSSAGSTASAAAMSPRPWGARRRVRRVAKDRDVADPARARASISASPVGSSPARPTTSTPGAGGRRRDGDLARRPAGPAGRPTARPGRPRQRSPAKPSVAAARDRVVGEGRLSRRRGCRSRRRTRTTRAGARSSVPSSPPPPPGPLLSAAAVAAVVASGRPGRPLAAAVVATAAAAAATAVVVGRCRGLPGPGGRPGRDSSDGDGSGDAGGSIDGLSTAGDADGLGCTTGVGPRSEGGGDARP